MADRKMIADNLKDSLASALTEITPIVLGERPARDNSKESIALWESWLKEDE